VADYLLTHFQISTPPALLGIAVLFIGFVLTKCIPTSIALAAKPLLSHMTLFFIPAIVAIVNFVDLIAAFPLALILAIVVSTIISLAVTALISQRLMYMLNPTIAKAETPSINSGKDQ